MKTHTLLLLSGGVSSRMQNKIPKQHMLLFGRPIIIHSLERIDKLNCIGRVIITCHKKYIDYLELMLQNYNFKKEILIIEGGETRQESVLKGLSHVLTTSVVIHEAARPFVRLKDFENLIKSEEKNISYGINIPFTVLKKDEDCISENLIRSTLVNIQLPQKFNTETLKSCHLKAITEKKSFTEDASLYLNYTKERIKLLKGNEFNIKITNPIDFKIGEIIYKDYILNEK